MAMRLFTNGYDVCVFGASLGPSARYACMLAQKHTHALDAPRTLKPLHMELELPP